MKNSAPSYFLISIVSVFCYTTSLEAQERTIKGVVTTFEDVTVAKAQVKSIRTKEVVMTDSIGVFRIACFPGDKIRISAKGFDSQSFKVTENTTTAFINLELKPNAKSKELAVAYGHVRDADNLNAVASVSTSDRNYADFDSVYDILVQIPNLRIVGSDVIIRGKNSINGSGAALIVVDRLIQPNYVLNSLPPQNIKDISILKGIAASAYGTRGGNGVVLITTKKGGE